MLGEARATVGAVLPASLVVSVSAGKAREDQGAPRWGVCKPGQLEKHLGPTFDGGTPLTSALPTKPDRTSLVARGSLPT